MHGAEQSVRMRASGAAQAPPWPRWPSAVAIVGALLTAIGGLLALLPSSEHLNKFGRNYADYFATRNLALAGVLVLVLAVRARRVLAVLMLLTASIQLLDAISAGFTGRERLIPVDLVFAVAFVLGAVRLQGPPLHRQLARWKAGPAARVGSERGRRSR